MPEWRDPDAAITLSILHTWACVSALHAGVLNAEADGMCAVHHGDPGPTCGKHTSQSQCVARAAGKALRAGRLRCSTSVLFLTRCSQQPLNAGFATLAATPNASF